MSKATSEVTFKFLLFLRMRRNAYFKTSTYSLQTTHYLLTKHYEKDK
ncbi:MAG: hypothetical protein UU98_C0016G0020 [Parcubacteria group bacterium GW2011_GWD2_42_14]|nr:MAG: hypothetical protein UU98_C0016G0020 [Parcubacteria group bacterium GW2011_GWD2_42_14]